MLLAAFAGPEELAIFVHSGGAGYRDLDIALERGFEVAGELAA